MKRKSFISIYVLIIITLISVSLSFVYKQSLNNRDLSEDIYHKKEGLYKLRSYYNIMLEDEKRLISFLKDYNEKPVFDDRYNISYFGNDDYLNCQKLDDNYFLLYKTLIYKNTKSNLRVYINLKNKYDLYKKDKIVLRDKFDEFFKNLSFKSHKFKKYNELNFDKKSLSSNIYIESDLYVKGDKKSSLSFSKSNFTNKSKTSKQINGIVIVRGDLILEENLDIEGLLIIKGDIIAENNRNLNLNGQIICENDYDINYNYKKDRSYDYIKDIYNPKFLKIRSVKVY